MERNLPMRWGCILLITIFALGCRGQSPTIANPFLGADRVPPPATQMPAPGTAQPYYPGDVMPGNPNQGNFNSTPTYDPGLSNPGNYNPGQYDPGQQQPGTSPVTPPGGWNPYPTPPPATSNPYSVQPTSASANSATLTGDSPLVRVPTDDGAARIAYQPQEQSASASQSADQFAAVDQQAPWLTTNGQIAVQPVSNAIPTPWNSTPIVSQQNISQQDVSQQPINAMNYVAPNQQAEIRMVSEAVPVTSSGDGFRPQGTSQLFTNPVTAGNPAPVSGVAAAIIGDGSQFGYDPQYTWLRGELNYSVLTGQWWLGYIPVGGMPDQFGGSIWLANPSDLVGLQSGEFVALQGHLVQREGLDGNPTVVFQATAFQRQSY